ncbi:hypothetical protein CRYUN_Cryun37aG0023900 [Craigia yunnanensis]
MFRARKACALFSTHFNRLRTRPFCSTFKDSNSNSNNNNNKNNEDNVDGKIESNVSTYNESYRQLDNLDFTTAAKILFTQPPKKKKFGIDFHLVQLFFACMPSLAVYLVAQYARYDMRKMEAELEEKKKQEEEAKRKQEEEEKKKQEEEEKAKETEQIATDSELLEVKVRLGKLEEAVKEIVVESKKQSAGSVTKSQQNASELDKDPSTSESSSSMEQDKVTKQKSTEQTPSHVRGKVVSDASQKDQKRENRIGEPSQDAKR